MSPEPLPPPRDAASFLRRILRSRAPGALLATAAAAAVAAFLATPGAGAAPGPSTVRIVAPADGTAVVGKVSLEIAWELPPGVTPLKVEYSVDGRLLATALDAPFQAIWDSGDGADPHAIRAKLYASDGSIAIAQSRTVARMGVQRAQILLVEVYVTVKDEDGRFVTDLPKEVFSIREEGAAQTLSLFVTERRPVQVALVLDVSASMRREERLTTAIEAARAFAEALEPGDRVAIIAFSDEPRVLVPFTTDRAAVLEAIGAAKPERGTALYDAIHLASSLLGREEGRRALVLLSDGQDLAFDGMGPGSARTFEESVTEALRQQVTAYTIGLGEQLESDWDFNRQHSAIQVLTRLAADTGGRFFPATRPGRLHGAFEKILEEMRFQYILGYNPKNDRRDGTWRSIEVEVRKPRVKVTARKGYFAPTE